MNLFKISLFMVISFFCLQCNSLTAFEGDSTQRPYELLQEAMDYIGLNFNHAQKNTLFAMFELKTYHSRYLFKELLLKTMDGSYHVVSSKGTIGEGGSKKAVLLEDEKVLMLPNMDVDSFFQTAHWWPDTVDAETTMTEFLDKINVPALNRAKAFLVIPSKQNPGISYELPVLISDSFDLYAKKSWFVIDMKNGRSSTWNNHRYDEEAGKFLIFKDIKDKLIIANWESLFKPLIGDIAKLITHGIKTGVDASNLAVVRKKIQDNDAWQLRYFGFDFSGKYGSVSIPSSQKNLSSYERLQILKRIKYTVYNWIQGFIVYDEPLRKNDQNIDGEINWDFACAVAEHFTNDGFLMKILSSLENIDQN